MLILQAEDSLVSHSPAPFRTTQNGALKNFKLAVKDLFAIKGYQNAAGNPDWLTSHEIAADTAPTVSALLDQGAQCIGLCLTDELAYSLEGNNPHYGLVENPVYKGHHTGGSSTGSAALVAADLADIALGTDTGGSVRIPASYCGIYGFRPSIDTVDKTGLIPLAPAFDTGGWFAKDAGLMQTLGNLLLNEQAKRSSNTFQTLWVLDDFLLLADKAYSEHQTQLIEQIGHRYHQVKPLSLPPELFASLPEIFRPLQGRSAWLIHKDWLATKPALSPAVKQRFEVAASFTDQEIATATTQQQALLAFVTDTIGAHDTLIMPTAPSPAPAIGEYDEKTRTANLHFTALAGLLGWPQCHSPIQGLTAPIGLSLIKQQHQDHALLAEIADIGAL